jgi:outer membrane receptor for ferrienterochelin and colicin
MFRTALATTALLGWLTTAHAQLEELDPIEGAAPVAAQAPTPIEDTAMILEGFEIDERDAVLSAARTKTSIQRAPGIITVITAEDIARWGHRTVNDVLRTVPGFEGGRLEANGWYEEATARGQPRTLLILVNGVNVVEPRSSGFTLDRKIPVHAIKRIEVTSGPGGVLWGSNALLGVVNIILKDSADLDGLQVVLGGGHGVGAQAAGLTHLAYGGTFLDKKIKLYTSFDLYTDTGAELEVDAIKVLGVLPAPALDGKTLYENRRGITDFNSRDWWVTSTGQASFGDTVTLDWVVEFERDARQIATGGALLDGTEAVGDTVVRKTEETVANDSYQQLALTWRDRIGPKLGMSAKGYAVRWTENGDPFWAFPPRALPGTDALKEGVAIAIQVGEEWRYGLNLDADYEINHSHHLIFGAEVFQERIADTTRRDTLRNNARLPDLAQPDAADPQVAAGIFGPGRCPPVGRHNVEVGDTLTPGDFSADCAFEETLLFDTTRTIGALYLTDQWTLHPKVVLQPGFRLQVSDAFDPVPLLSAAFVWNVVDKIFMKINYAEGFRPAEFQAGRINPAGISSVSYQSDPNIDVERSQAGEMEINAIFFENTGALDRVYLRMDYAYTLVSDLVRNRGGVFGNSGESAIHAAEFLVRAELEGDHDLWFSGHHVQAEDSISGPVRNFPNWVFSGGARTTLFDGHLELSTLATFTGPQEDLNRAADTGDVLAGFNTANASDIEVDHIDAYVLLRAGFRVLKLWDERVTISGFVYNAANQKYYQPDFFFDDRVTSRPQPRPGWSALGQLSVRFF